MVTMKKEETMVCYCIFCVTQKTSQILEELSSGNIIPGLTVLQPKIVQRKWIRKNATEEIHDYLPGYLFLYTKEQIQPRFDISGIIRCLGNSELNGQDLAFAEMIYQKKGVMGIISLMCDGERCRINDPAWEQIHGKVIRMDKGRKRCCIEFEFDGIKRSIWAGYEIVLTEQDDMMPDGKT